MSISYELLASVYDYVLGYARFSIQPLFYRDFSDLRHKVMFDDGAIYDMFHIICSRLKRRKYLVNRSFHNDVANVLQNFNAESARDVIYLSILLQTTDAKWDKYMHKAVADYLCYRSFTDIIRIVRETQYIDEHKMPIVHTWNDMIRTFDNRLLVRTRVISHPDLLFDEFDCQDEYIKNAARKFITVSNSVIKNRHNLRDNLISVVADLKDLNSINPRLLVFYCAILLHISPEFLHAKIIVKAPMLKYKAPILNDFIGIKPLINIIEEYVYVHEFEDMLSLLSV